MRAASTLLSVLLVVLVVVTATPNEAVTAQEGATRVALADWTPLPAAGQAEVSAEAQALRAELLGPDALDPDTVTMHWFGVSGFVLTYRGHLLLLDAWEIIGATNDYAPIGREELAALEPEAILIGHGHFDHAADAGYVAGRTGAPVVGSEEICDNAEADATAEGNTITCVITGTADTPAPGTAQPLQLFVDTEPITVLQHIHSAATPPGPDNPPNPQVPVFDPAPYIEHFADDPEELARFVASQSDQQGGTWMYHFVADDFTLLWGNSSGPIFTDPAVGEALGAFPGCVDVMSNAILGFDQVVSGLQDPRLYVDAVQPKVYLPQHGDAWAPVISAGQAQYVPLWKVENTELGIGQPATRFLVDPDEYMVPVAFDINDPLWADETPGSACATQRIDRRWGPERHATAVRLSQARFAPGADEVWLATGASYSDALAAVPAAALTASPVLTVRPDSIPTVVADELHRLRPSTVVIVGDETVIGAGVEEALATLGFAADDVERIGSGDAYQRAAAVSAARFDAAETVVVTTGERFPDALAAGPLAAARQAPLLLTEAGTLPEATAAELQRLADGTGLPGGDPLQVVIVGGTAAVDDAVADAIAAITGGPVTRVAGPDRVATAAAVAALEDFDGAPTVYVARSDDFPDAVVAGAPASVDGAPVLLVGRDAVPEATRDALAVADGAAWAVVAGGDAVIGPAVRQQVSDALPD